jgi:integrase
MLELMARSCMRVAEVLKLKPRDIEDRKVIIRDPKSRKEAEVAFLPQKVADRLQKYISDNGIKPEERIFPVTYAAARIIVKNAGDLVGIHLKPHDLRRHATTYASRALSITQIFLGKISDAEAIRWIDNLHG